MTEEKLTLHENTEVWYIFDSLNPKTSKETEPVILDLLHIRTKPKKA